MCAEGEQSKNLVQKVKVIVPAERREVRQGRLRAVPGAAVLGRKVGERGVEVLRQRAGARHERHAGKEVGGEAVELRKGEVHGQVGGEACEAAAGRVFLQVARRAGREWELGKRLQGVGRGGVQAGDGALHAGSVVVPWQLVRV